LILKDGIHWGEIVAHTFIAPTKLKAKKSEGRGGPTGGGKGQSTKCCHGVKTSGGACKIQQMIGRENIRRGPGAKGMVWQEEVWGHVSGRVDLGLTWPFKLHPKTIWTWSLHMGRLKTRRGDGGGYARKSQNHGEG